jgi:hypothetical protein
MSEWIEKRLKMDALVRVDLAVDGRLLSQSGLDSIPPNGEARQSGNCWGDITNDGMIGAGVFGGEKGLIESMVMSETSIGSTLPGSDALISYIMFASLLHVRGSSMLGMGTSAAATDSRNCCVGAVFI